MSTPPKTETQTMVVTGCELAEALQQAAGEGWRLVAQSTLGANEFELTFARKQEGRP